MSILARAIRTWETRPLPALALPAVGLRRALSFAVALGLLLLFVCVAVLLWTDVLKTYEDRSAFQPREGRGDFIAFYVAGEFVVEGRGDEIYDLDSLSSRENELMPPTEAESRELPFYNPPFVAGLFALISLLSYEQALWVWLVVNVVVLAACIAALDRLLQRESVLLRLLFALGAVSSIPVYRAVGLGQASLFVLLFSTLASIWLGERRERRTGLMVGLLLIKPQYAILPALHLVLERKRQAVAGLLAIAAAGFIASLVIAGPSVLIDYPRLLLESGSWSEERGIYPANWFSWTGFFYSLSLSSTISTALGLGLGLAGAGAALWTANKAGDRSDPRAVLLAGAALTVAILLLSPHVYRQDLVLLLLPAAVLLALTSGFQQALSVAFLLILWLAAWVPVAVPALTEPPWQELAVEELGFNLFVPLMAVLLVAMIGLALQCSDTAPKPSWKPLLSRHGWAYDGRDATKCSDG